MTETSTVLKTFSRQDIAVSLEESPVFRHGEDVNYMDAMLFITIVVVCYLFFCD